MNVFHASANVQSQIQEPLRDGASDAFKSYSENRRLLFFYAEAAAGCAEHESFYNHTKHSQSGFAEQAESKENPLRSEQ